MSRFAVENYSYDTDFLIILLQWILSQVQSLTSIHSTVLQAYPLERTITGK